MGNQLGNKEGALGFNATLAELAGLFHRYVLVTVFGSRGAPPAAVLLGKLRRGESGETFYEAPVLGENDVTFFVGADEPGGKAAFFLSPDTFAEAWWENGALIVRSHDVQHMVMPLDEIADAIEEARGAASGAALAEGIADVRRRLSEASADEAGDQPSV